MYFCKTKRIHTIWHNTLYYIELTYEELNARRAKLHEREVAPPLPNIRRHDMHVGEIISLGVACSWTVTALLAEVASKRIGSLPLNITRMAISLTLLAIILWVTTGVPYPYLADGKTWLWLCLSGFVGYVLGDYCLFNCYIHIGSRFGQLFMTLSAPTAALLGRILLGEQMNEMAFLGMFVTLLGICITILGKSDPDEKNKTGVKLRLPLKGVLYAIGAGVGQGFGLVLSKIGMEYYEDSIAAQGIQDIYAYYSPNALLHISMGTVMPFASTMIRGLMGIIGFSLALFVFGKNGGQQIADAVRDRKSMLCALGSSFFGPCVGVSLSLMATLYTKTGIAQTIMSLTPILIIAPAAVLFHQKVTLREIVGAVVSVGGVCLFFL